MGVECPGCYKMISTSEGDRSFAKIAAHEIFCHPPGFLDLMIYYDKGHITDTLARWVGNSIERMAGAR